MADSSGAEQARMPVKEFSKKDMDELVQISSFKDKVADVGLYQHQVNSR